MAPAKRIATDEYRVVNCGASYKLPGEENSRRFALRGQLIELDAEEAERLRALGAVVGKDEPDPTPEQLLALAGEKAPVEHAQPLQSQEEHAEKVKSRKRGKAAEGAKAPDAE